MLSSIQTCSEGSIDAAPETQSEQEATVSVAERVVPNTADIVTGVDAPTLVELIAKTADDCPSGMSMVAGNVATLVFELASTTAAPPGGAGWSSVRVAVDVIVPPTTFAGESVTADRATGLGMHDGESRGLKGALKVRADGDGLLHRQRSRGDAERSRGSSGRHEDAARNRGHQTVVAGERYGCRRS
jgi:hypothetical protein